MFELEPGKDYEFDGLDEATLKKYGVWEDLEKICNYYANSEEAEDKKIRVKRMLEFKELLDGFCIKHREFVDKYNPLVMIDYGKNGKGIESAYMFRVDQERKEEPKTLLHLTLAFHIRDM